MNKRNLVIILFLLVFISGCSTKHEIYLGDSSSEAIVPSNEQDNTSLEEVIPVQAQASDEIQIETQKNDLGPIKYILVYVPNGIAEHLAEELNQYKADVESELHATVVLRSDDWRSKESIKSDIQGYKDNLLGVLLIGNLPTAQFSAKNIAYSVANDFYYVDLDDKCEFDASKEAFDSSTCELAFSRLYSDYWMGRLTPPVEAEDMQVVMLKNYFKRNHEFRTGLMDSNRKLLISYPAYDYSVKNYDRAHADSEIQSYTQPMFYFPELGLWKKEDTNVIYFDSEAETEEQYDQRYLGELAKPYQFVMFNAHGDVKTHEFHIDKEKIIRASPKARFIEAKSCSLGKFTEKDYLAGWMLFSGETLAVFANSNMAFESNLIDLDTFFRLKQGMPIGAYLRNEWTDYKALLGDPTLRIDYGVEAKNALIEVDVKEMDLGTLSATKKVYDELNTEIIYQNSPSLEFTIKNKGSDTLVYVPSARIPAKIGIGYGGCIYNHCILKPGESHTRTLKINEIYSLSNNEKMEENIDAFIEIASNDPINPIVRIPVKGRISLTER